MIPVAKVKKPKDFDQKVKAPGDEWLKANPSATRPEALWIPYTSTLADGFARLCGYAAMHDPTGGTVDHYLSFKKQYLEGKLSLAGLREMAPLLAQAVEKQAGKKS